MQTKKKTCNSCGEFTYMWTRKYGCKACSAKKNLENNTNKPYKPLKKPVKAVSHKQAKSNIKVKSAKRNVMQKQLNEFGYFFCKSCGTKEGRIDLSHLIPIGYNKKLEAVEENITFHCERCHSNWEHLTSSVKDFKDLKDLLSRVKKLDESYYNRIKSKGIITN